MKIKCSCGQVYSVKPEWGGKKLKCKKCDRVFQVPIAVAENRQMPSPKPHTALGGAGYWVKPGEMQAASPAKQSTRRTKKTKAKPETKEARETAILDEFSSKDSLEERMANRHRESIESERVSNSVIVLLKGAAWIAGAVFAFWVLSSIEENGLTFRGGRRRGVISGLIAILYFLKGKYWVPPILILVGIYHFCIGVGSLAGKVDIDNDGDSW